ncbi:MAG: GTPase HflX [Candidatus Pacebacteria bacterium]|nr:GTPase HflX [Candidatus Paceibacterota bacterium]
MLTFTQHLNFMIVSLISHTEDRVTTRANADEIESLVKTYGGVVCANSAQNAARADGATYIGTGKAYELAEQVAAEEINVVVINDNIKSSQLYALKSIFEQKKPNIQVWDRTDLILQIFEKHASTAEAKLQIKLANVRHKGPEARDINASLSKQGFGVGARGQGETNTTLLRRMWKEEMRSIQKQLETMSSNRAQQMEHRRRIGLPTISIVGYTNAGKSTLFNLLTKKNTKVENALFATLDSSVGKFYLPHMRREAFITDTIGFIQNLPTELIDAFKSTLMETVGADLLLHVIDMSDEQLWDKIAVVGEILKSLKMQSKKKIYVFNKIDTAPNINMDQLSEQFFEFHPQFISAKNGQSIPQLVEAIQKELR